MTFVQSPCLMYSRQSFLCYLVDDVSGRYTPIPTLPPLEADLLALESLPSLLPPSSGSSPAVQAAFDKKVQRRLRQAMPLVPVEIGNWQETMSRCRAMVRGLILVGALARSESMAVWKVSQRRCGVKTAVKIASAGIAACRWTGGSTISRACPVPPHGQPVPPP